MQYYLSTYLKNIKLFPGAINGVNYNAIITYLYLYYFLNNIKNKFLAPFVSPSMFSHESERLPHELVIYLAKIINSFSSAYLFLSKF